MLGVRSRGQAILIENIPTAEEFSSCMEDFLEPPTPPADVYFPLRHEKQTPAVRGQAVPLGGGTPLVCFFVRTH